jgi:hypothetical protein
MKKAPQENESKPWDMQPGETSKAFQAFTVYRDLAPHDRSLTAAACSWVTEENLNAAAGLQNTNGCGGQQHGTKNRTAKS